MTRIRYPIKLVIIKQVLGKNDYWKVEAVIKLSRGTCVWNEDPHK